MLRRKFLSLRSSEVGTFSSTPIYCGIIIVYRESETTVHGAINYMGMYQEVKAQRTYIGEQILAQAQTSTKERV